MILRSRVSWLMLWHPTVLSYFNHVQLIAALWIVACHAPLFMGFSRQEYCSGLPFPPPGDLPNPGIKPMSLLFPVLAGRFFIIGLPWWLSGRESACQCRRHGLDPWVRKIPWKRKWQPTTVFLPGKFHVQRSLAGYSPWSHKSIGYDLASKQQ